MRHDAINLRALVVFLVVLPALVLGEPQSPAPAEASQQAALDLIRGFADPAFKREIPAFESVTLQSGLMKHLVAQDPSLSTAGMSGFEVLPVPDMGSPHAFPVLIFLKGGKDRFHPSGLYASKAFQGVCQRFAEAKARPATETERVSLHLQETTKDAATITLLESGKETLMVGMVGCQLNLELLGAAGRPLTDGYVPRRDTPERALEAFGIAILEKDLEAFRKTTTPALVESLGPHLGKLAKTWASAHAMAWEKVEGSVTVAVACHGPDYTLTLTQEKDGWVVSGFQKR